MKTLMQSLQSWYKIANIPIQTGIQDLSVFLSDPNLQYLTCVYNAKRLLDENDFYGAINALRVDCDKIRMINRELYDYIGNIAMPMSQNDVDKWHEIWDKQEGKR